MPLKTGGLPDHLTDRPAALPYLAAGGATFGIAEMLRQSFCPLLFAARPSALMYSGSSAVAFYLCF
jgi:hypothetical protein